MTIALLHPPVKEDATLDRHYGVRAALQMLRAKEVTRLEFLALCEEAAELADTEQEPPGSADRHRGHR